MSIVNSMHGQLIGLCMDVVECDSVMQSEAPRPDLAFDTGAREPTLISDQSATTGNTSKR